MIEVKLAIVGAGPAGVSTALFLQARAPRIADRMVILEKATHPRDKICAGAVGRRAERLLETIGVEVDVPSAPIRGIGVRTAERELVVRDDRVIGRVVKRRAFDAALAKVARDRGIRIREGASVQRVRERAGGWEIELADGEVVRARTVVGADGVGSVVRRELGFPKGSLMAQAVEVDTLRRETDSAEDVVMFDMTRPELRGYVWDFPTPGGGAAGEVCRGVYQLRDGGLAARADVEGVLEQHVGGVERTSAVRRFAERGLARHEPIARGTAMLVGESAGIDPVLGEGIAQAISYGAAAGTFLAERWGARAGAGPVALEDWPAALRRTRLGLDLRARTAAVPLVYGHRRDVLERWVTQSVALARVGMAYFAGERVPRRAMLEAAGDFARAITAITR